MGFRNALFVSFVCLVNLLAAAAANAQATTEPLTLTPATSPATAPQKYPDVSQQSYSTYPRQGYANSGVTYYNVPGGPATSNFFDRNEFEISLGGMGYTTHGDHGNDSLGFVTVEAGWYFVPNVSLDLQLGLSPGYNHHHDHHDDDEGLRAEEEMVLVRWHCLNAGGLSLFIDGGVGGLHASPAFPNDGRKDNFMAAAAGGGLSLQILPHFYGSLGARAAFLDGGDWNHHHDHHTWSDGVQYYGQLSVILP